MQASRPGAGARRSPCSDGLRTRAAIRLLSQMPKKNKGTERGAKCRATYQRRQAWLQANPELAAQGFMFCCECETGKPREGFYRLPRTGGYYPTCRDCQNRRGNEWKAKNAQHYLEQSRRAWLTTKYGITVEDYDRMALAQNGRCAVCGGPPVGRGTKNDRFHVDHDHATGQVRGLLCFRCNNGLGYMRDSPEILEAAIRYLQRSRSEAA